MLVNDEAPALTSFEEDRAAETETTGVIVQFSNKAEHNGQDVGR